MLVEGRAVSCNRLIVFIAPRLGLARLCPRFIDTLPRLGVDAPGCVGVCGQTC
jgi:hypothetical protein